MMKRENIKSYSELKKLETFEERFDYLKMHGQVGEDTFGFDRYLNQDFYKSKKWSRIRDEVILRDMACDLGIKDNDIHSTIYVHHMNPIYADDVKTQSEYLINPEYLISTSFDTHNAIHFGNKENLNKNKPALRFPNDHCPWRKIKMEEKNIK